MEQTVRAGGRGVPIRQEQTVRAGHAPSSRSENRLARAYSLASMEGLADIARHVNPRTLNLRLSSKMAPYDVAWRILLVTSSNAL